MTEKDREWWAFQPLRRESESESESGKRGVGANAIDRLILRKAQEKKLALNKTADKRTLIRRAYFDLLGLPPTPEEVEAFVKDRSKDAWPRLIDKLLDSPHYGERWARHWLDVARFAESSGFEHDFDREGAFYYRDFVIKALNSDMPYDQFVRWQLAGDEFAPTNAWAMAATGFIGAGVFPTQITANEVERTRYDALDDMLATTSVAFMGLTVGCARCHDHKYDPIPSRDYYRMLSTFTTTVRSEVDLDMEPAKTKAKHAAWKKKEEALKAELAEREAELKPAFEKFLAGEQSADLEGSANRVRASLPRVLQGHYWALLDVAKFTSKGGATFLKREDGSYLAQGANADEDVYTIVGGTSLKRVAAIRLDALSDSSLPHGGPGRADNGNFALSKVRVFVVDGEPKTQNATDRKASSPQPSPPKEERGKTPEPKPNERQKDEVKVVRAVADFEQNDKNLSVASSIDSDAKTGWAVDPQFGKDHSAMFILEKPVELTNGMTLKIVLDFHVNTKHNIGRPRVSATDDEQASLKYPVMPPRVAELLADAKAIGRAEDRAAVFDWWKQLQPLWREANGKVVEHAAQEPDGKTKVLICGEGYKPVRMYTQGADFFEQTYFLKRGSTDLKDGVATQGFLQVLSRDGSTERWKIKVPEKAKFSGRRATLANWIVDTNNGAGILAARVAVNRLWQHHFGRGIVETPNDFGHAGSLPTHPELLDFLASELLRNEWRLKPIHKLIMMSATYMQSTAPDAKKEAADPENKYFCRRLPKRLEGEAIRDCMLAVSGELDATMFGPGTKDEHSKRRSIYFTIKRSQLMGSMVAFDCPEPLVSQGFRPTTTVAPQALLILNGPQVRDWAEALARRAGSESESESGELVTRAYQVALSRKPTRVEAKDAAAFLAKQVKSYQADEKTAKNARALAATDFCQVLFGLNEFVYEN